MNTLENPLSLVLAPVSQHDFIDSHWEQSPLHISRDSEEHFSALLTVQHIETLLSTQALHYPSVQLTKSDNPVPVTHYTDDANRISPLALIEHHKSGATIVISQAHEKIPSLSNFRLAVQQMLNLRCQTNVYLSPPGKQGFNAHYDSHDVFILQVHGSKTFNIYGGGVELPYSYESFESGTHVAGTLQESIILKPGDTLYIPRGVMHDAVANDETSLHITLGVYATTLKDVLLETARLLADQDARFRRSVPRPQIAGDAQSGAELSATLSNLFAEGIGPELLEEVVAQLNDEITLDANADCAGLLVDSSEHPVPDLTSTVRFRQPNTVSLQRTGSTVRCRGNSVVLEFQDPLGAGVEQLYSSTTMTVAELDGLLADQQIALCERLLYTNLLEII